jgi:hypothetical protein
MRKFTLISLATLLALAPSAFAQSGNFIVSQHGKSVGTASFSFASKPDGYDSKSAVRISMQGLDYTLSKTERLTAANRLSQAELKATINSSVVTVTAAPVANAEPPQIQLDTTANGKTTNTTLAAHDNAVFLPDFDPGAFETLLALGVASNNRDLWAIIPKGAGSIAPIQLATFADLQGTLDGQPIAVHHQVAKIAGTSTDLFSGPENQLLQAELPQQGFALVRKGFVLTPPAKPVAPPEAPEPEQSTPPAK